MKIDLHIHSNASDGQYPPEETVRLAADAGIVKMALTDHDTMKGLRTAEASAKDCGIELIRGIEISSELDLSSARALLDEESLYQLTPSGSAAKQYMEKYKADSTAQEALLDALTNEEIHILGYGVDPDSEKLNEACLSFEQDRLDRGPKICRFLAEKGIDVDMDEVQAIRGSGSLGRPHFAQYLMRHGFVGSIKEAFDLYLDTDEFQEATARIKPTPYRSISLIHAAGGRAVLAHPGLLELDRKMQELLIASLVKAGLDGIECFYDKHDSEQTDYYLSLREHFGLRTGCGSDYHGERVKPDVRLGMILPEKYIEHLI